MIRVTDPHARKRIIAIAEQLVTSQVAKGLVDPADDKALRKATRQAVRDAAAAFFAAEEFLCG